MVIHKEGNRLTQGAVEKKLDLLALLTTLEPITDEFPDIDGDLMPLDSTELANEFAPTP
ncbi:MAG: hypothetical protein Q8O37_07050 [Sulfuricellaceae bacterium]|nr:hypothetical protein [Sulfuricellaceae bacterium]